MASTDLLASFAVLDPSSTPRWRALLLAHYLRLDAEARRLRFFTTMSDAALRAHVARMQPLALVVYQPDGQWRGSAEVYSGDQPGTGEIAVSVEAPWQNRGLGAALTGRARDAARDSGLADVRLICLRRNGAMLGVARKLQAHALPLADWALALFRLEVPQTP
ncbi:MAG: GNAT family N-acetyltransferase [Alkalilacustris sp.]